MALPQPESEMEMEVLPNQEANIDEIMNSIRTIIVQDESNNEPPTPPKASNSNEPPATLVEKIETALTGGTGNKDELAKTLERLMQPLLQDWLSEHLPQMVEQVVEKLVREEIELIRQGK